MIRHKTPGGQSIFESVHDMVATARRCGKPVTTTFNGVKMVAEPGESAETVMGRYDLKRLSKLERIRKHEELISSSNLRLARAAISFLDVVGSSPDDLPSVRKALRSTEMAELQDATKNWFDLHPGQGGR
jgi:hypothetical protein